MTNITVTPLATILPDRQSLVPIIGRICGVIVIAPFFNISYIIRNYDF